MAQKKAVLAAMAFLLVALIVLGALALAAEAGGKEDPLVSVSYLKGLEPELMASIDQMTQEKLDEYTKELQTQLDEAKRKLGELSAAGAGVGGLTDELIQAIAAEVKKDLPVVSAAPSGAVPATYARVEIAANKTVTLGEGASFFLRTGSATVVTPAAPGLIDLTTGGSLDSGAVQANHLYTVTFNNSRGFKTSNAVIVFIMGPYTIT